MSGRRPSVCVAITVHETHYTRAFKFGWGLNVVIKSTSVTNSNVSLRSWGGGGRKFSVVGVTTCYGVDGPGFDPGGRQTFRAVIVRTFLGALAKLRISVIISVCPSVRPHGTTRLPRKGFSWNIIFHYFWQSVKKIQVSLKYDKNNGYFTWAPINTFYHISLNSS